MALSKGRSFLWGQKYSHVHSLSGLRTEQTRRFSRDQGQWIRVHWEMKKKLAGRQTQVLQGQSRYFQLR